MLKQRYLIKDENGEPVETIDGMFVRVAKAIAAADTLHDEKADTAETEKIFYDMMTNLEFLPNSPTLMNAGRGSGTAFRLFCVACRRQHGIYFEAIKQAALIHKSGRGEPDFPFPGSGRKEARLTPRVAWPAVLSVL